MYTLHAAIQYRLYHVHYDDSTLPRSHPSRCHIRSFCELHIDDLLPQTSFSSFFLSLSASHSTPVSLPLIPGKFEHCCLARHSCWLLSSCRLWLPPADEFGVGASLPYRMHVQYGLHGTVVSVHLRYSTVCTMLTVGASLPYRMRVRAASNDSLRATVVHYRLYHAGTTIRSRCHICFFCELNIVHHFLPQTSLSSFLSGLISICDSHASACSIVVCS